MHREPERSLLAEILRDVRRMMMFSVDWGIVDLGRAELRVLI